MLTTMPTPTQKRQSRVRRVAGMVKTVVTLISWSLFIYCAASSSFTSTVASHAAAAFQYSNELLLRTSLSPHFVFLVGNAIILTLLLHSSAASAGNRKISIPAAEFDSDLSSGEQQIAAAYPVRVEDVMAPTAAEIPRRIEPERKRLRTRSVGLEAEMTATAGGDGIRAELRRWETGPRRNTTGRGGEVEDLSGEEFRRKVEAFIARQQRFLREESLSATTTTATAAATAAVAAVFVN